MMSQTCPNCGTLNLDTYRFCSNCGALLKASEANQPPAQTQPEQPQQPAAQPQPLPDVLAPAPLAPTNNVAQPAESFTPPSSSFAPPSASETAAFDVGASSSQPVQPADQPAYVVKTTPEAENLSAQPVAPPSSGFIPPASGAPPQPTQPMPGTMPPPPSGSYPGPGFSAGTANVQDGGVYTPYPTTPVAALEKPKENRSWLVPVIVVAALALVGLGAIGFYALQNNGGAGSGDNGLPISQATPAPTKAAPVVGGGEGEVVATVTPTPSCAEVPAEPLEDSQIRDVIKASNERQIQAWVELDPNLLKEHYTGQALADNINMVNQLRQSNMEALPVNEKLDILDVTVGCEKDTATAHTREVWSVTFTNKADGSKNVTGPDTLDETYFLVKKDDGKWYVNDLIIPTPVPATPTVIGN